MKRVVVGLSGGVDSSVAAFLLKEAGYDVIGIFMKNWTDESVTLHDECPWIEDSADAMLVAEKLNIPFQTIDFSKAYKSRIVDYMFSEYEKGRTPNPDVLCNREIKFDVFLETALKLNADFVATGHYCQKEEIVKNGESLYKLLAGRDHNKDQSYFLCQVSQAQLKHALFPIGHLEKSEVRAIAQREGLITANKKDSQGLCFVGKIALPDFLQQQLAIKKGPVVQIPASHAAYHNNDKTNDIIAMSRAFAYRREDGRVIGEHDGAHFFTIGQRKGLQIGGHAEPLFVIATDTKENIIYVGEGEKHPGLHRPALKIDGNNIHWIRPDLAIQEGQDMRVLCRIRYRQPLQEATLHLLNGDLYIQFDQLQKGITAGQFAAWYMGEELIGSGTIDE